MGGRQRAEGVGDRRPVVQAGATRRVVLDPDLADLEVHPPALLALERSEVVGQLVARDPAQPGDDVGSTVEPGPLVDRRNERLLAELLGEVHVVPTPSQEIAEDAREFAPVPGFEGGVVRERQLELVDAVDGAGASGHLPRVRLSRLA